MLMELTDSTGTGTSEAEPDEAIPGEAMTVMAGMLARRGFDIRGPEHDDSRVLTITNARGGRCQLDLHDEGYLGWEYIPWNSGAADPAALSAMVLRLLGAEGSGPGDRHEGLPRGGRLKAAVARELDACGLNVTLDVFEDPVGYDVFAEVVVTNPAQPRLGTVRIDDDGGILWECAYGEPGDRHGAGAIADATADVLVSRRSDMNWLHGDSNWLTDGKKHG